MVLAIRAALGQPGIEWYEALASDPDEARAIHKRAEFQRKSNEGSR